MLVYFDTGKSGSVRKDIDEQRKAREEAAEKAQETRARGKMRVLRTISPVGIIVLGIGCIPCVHPIYTKHDLMFDSTLVGQ